MKGLRAIEIDRRRYTRNPRDVLPGHGRAERPHRPGNLSDARAVRRESSAGINHKQPVRKEAVYCMRNAMPERD